MRLTDAKSLRGCPKDFNPRTREGCDLPTKSEKAARQSISIHAPVKGATSHERVYSHHKRDFNPRTREGCDKPFQGFFPCQWYFNPRTREGCDPYGADILKCYLSISIHAPVKGATCPLYILHASLRYFNPRTREGCDIFRGGTYIYIKIFQSTHPCRVRLRAAKAAVFVIRISIHAPVKGATRTQPLLPLVMGHFNPRTREGCDLLPCLV